SAMPQTHAWQPANALHNGAMLRESSTAMADRIATRTHIWSIVITEPSRHRVHVHIVDTKATKAHEGRREAGEVAHSLARRPSSLPRVKRPSRPGKESD